MYVLCSAHTHTPTPRFFPTGKSEGDLAIIRDKFTDEPAAARFADYLGLVDLLLVSSRHDMVTDSSYNRTVARTLYALMGTSLSL